MPFVSSGSRDKTYVILILNSNSKTNIDKNLCHSLGNMFSIALPYVDLSGQ